MSLPSRDLEQLTQDAERYPDQLPRSSNRDEALEIAIKAAETSMKALKLASDPDEKARHSTRFKQLIQEAERIKHSKDWRQELQPPSNLSTDSKAPTISGTSRPRYLKDPQSTRPLPKSEQILLLKAGYLNNCKFPPWTNPPAPDEFELKDGETLYSYVC